jgi:hypothetical protein
MLDNIYNHQNKHKYNNKYSKLNNNTLTKPNKSQTNLIEVKLS